MFSITENQRQQIKKWVDNLPEADTGAIGGRLIYMFTPTSIGTGLTVRDTITETELDVTDYDSW